MSPLRATGGSGSIRAHVSHHTGGEGRRVRAARVREERDHHRPPRRQRHRPRQGQRLQVPLADRRQGRQVHHRGHEVHERHLRERQEDRRAAGGQAHRQDLHRRLHHQRRAALRGARATAPSRGGRTTPSEEEARARTASEDEGRTRGRSPRRRSPRSRAAAGAASRAHARLARRGARAKNKQARATRGWSATPGSRRTSTTG